MKHYAYLVVLVLGMIVLVFSTEGILSLLRTRNINVVVEVRDSNTGLVPTQQATADPSKGQQPADVVIAPEQQIAIKATWDYRIGPRFPQLSVEKEFAQATGRAETVNLTDRQALRQVLEQNRYLVKQLCWVMSVAPM